MNQRTQTEDGAASDGVTDPPKRLGRRSAEESRKTRRALLNAAVLEFSEKGMSGARIDEIAERAGVTKGAVYTHFDGREDLLVEACRSAIRSLQVMRFASEAADLSTFVDETARRLLAPEAKSARMLISELYASAMRSDVIADLLAEWHAAFVETVKDRVPPELSSPETIALALNFLFVAISRIEVYEHGGVDREEVLAIVNRLAASLLSAT